MFSLRGLKINGNCHLVLRSTGRITCGCVLRSTFELAGWPVSPSEHHPGPSLQRHGAVTKIRWHKVHMLSYRDSSLKIEDGFGRCARRHGYATQP